MLDFKTLEKFDSKKMYEIYDSWPKLARESWDAVKNPVKLNKINHIVFAGMGGSGTIGDLFNAVFSTTNIHITLIKGYLLPKTIDENTLVVCTSISGNTVETLSILNQASSIDCQKIVISSGGKMEQFCKDKSIDYFKIPFVHSPRASFTVFLYTILHILEFLLPIKKSEILDSIKELEKLQAKINSNNLNEDNISLEIAKWIKGIPIILYPHGFQAVAFRFKNALQENAKNHAIVEDIIEFCHNGIVALEKKSNIHPILIQGKDDYVKTKERWKILKEFFDQENIEFKEIFSIDGNILSKIITLIYLLDYATIYKAVIDGTDPSPVMAIDFIKDRLR